MPGLQPIYEGTSQLQTVAAIRYVTTGAYLARIREYEAEEVAPEFATLKKTLMEMAEQYEQACALVHGHDNTYIDFHARRLVEMAGYTIIGYLLLQDAQKCDKYVKSAEIFINYGKAKVAAHDEMINSFNPDKLGIYKKN